MKALKEKIKSERENFRDSNKNLDENDKAVKNRFKKIQIVALISFASILIVLILTPSGNVSINSLTEKTAGNPKKSIITLISLFAVKSLTIIIPLPSLYVASGILFDPLKAVAVSYLGLAVTLTIPFILGRWSGTEEIHYIKKKYPKIEKVIEMQERNEFLAGFIIRLIGWFPCDVLSFYFGCLQDKLSKVHNLITFRGFYWCNYKYFTWRCNPKPSFMAVYGYVGHKNFDLHICSRHNLSCQ